MIRKTKTQPTQPFRSRKDSLGGSQLPNVKFGRQREGLQCSKFVHSLMLTTFRLPLDKRQITTSTVHEKKPKYQRVFVYIHHASLCLAKIREYIPAALHFSSPRLVKFPYVSSNFKNLLTIY